jgi:twitching motility protein PilT
VAGLGEILVDQGVLQPEQLQHATAHAGEGGSLARALVELGYAGEADLVRAFATNLGMPYAEVDAGNVDPNAAGLLPVEVAASLVALPVGFGEGDSVLVAVADPNAPELVGKLQAEIGLPVTLALAPRRALVTAIEQHAANQVPTGAGAAARASGADGRRTSSHRAAGDARASRSRCRCASGARAAGSRVARVDAAATARGADRWRRPAAAERCARRWG